MPQDKATCFAYTTKGEANSVMFMIIITPPPKRKATGSTLKYLPHKRVTKKGAGKITAANDKASLNTGLLTTVRGAVAGAQLTALHPTWSRHTKATNKQQSSSSTVNKMIATS